MKHINILRSLGIKKRLWLILILESILLLTGYYFIANGYNRLERQKTLDSITQLNVTLITEADYTANTLNSITKYPYVSIPYQVSHSVWDYLINPEKLQQERTAYNVLFTEMYYKLNLLFPQLDSIFIYSNEGELLSFQNNDLTNQKLESNIKGRQWFDQANDKNGELYFPTHEEMINSGYAPRARTIFASRSLSYVTLPRPAGVILSGLDASNILTQFQSHRVFPSQSFALFTADNRCLLSSDEVSEIKGFEEYTRDKRTYDFNIQTNPKKNLVSVIRTPKKDILWAALPLNIVLFLLIPCILFINLLVTLMIVKSINNPLNRVVEACKRLSEGDFSACIEYEGQDEIGILTEAFNHMAAEVKRLITQVYEKSLTEKDLELQMLRSQINPHFLYNTLDSMRMAALTKGYGEQARMCELLAKILRYGVTKCHKTVQVSEEVKHLEDYMELIGLRFGNIIHFNLMIDPSILHLPVIRLLLQPLVENSINHGIKDCMDTGEIQIWGYKKERTLVFTVSDNGSGMDQEELSLLLDYLDNKNQEFKSIGLKNIKRRIQLNYGEEYGLSIQSRRYGGTSVTITIPLTEKEEAL